MAINTATIQHRRGSLDDFNPEKLTPGELAVITDERSVYMGFPGGEAEKIVLEKDFTSESIKEKLGYEPADEERVDQLFRDKADYQYVDEKVSNVKVDLTGYAKEDYVDAEVEKLDEKIVQETSKLSNEIGDIIKEDIVAKGTYSVQNYISVTESSSATNTGNYISRLDVEPDKEMTLCGTVHATAKPEKFVKINFCVNEYDSTGTVTKRNVFVNGEPTFIRTQPTTAYMIVFSSYIKSGVDIAYTETFTADISVIYGRKLLNPTIDIDNYKVRDVGILRLERGMNAYSTGLYNGSSQKRIVTIKNVYEQFPFDITIKGNWDTYRLYIYLFNTDLTLNRRDGWKTEDYTIPANTPFRVEYGLKTDANMTDAEVIEAINAIYFVGSSDSWIGNTVLKILRTGAEKENKSELPEYVEDEIERVKNALISRFVLSNNTCVFAVHTDQHMGESIEEPTIYGLKALSKITKFVPCNCVCLCGDSAGYNAEGDEVSEIIYQILKVNEPLADADCKVVSITGNHDSFQNNPNITNGQLFNAHLKKAVAKDEVVNSDQISTNAYYDDRSVSVRFIFCDTEPRTGYVALTECRTWLQKCLSELPEGYKAVIFSHHALTDEFNVNFDSDTGIWQGINCQLVLAPYADKIICCVSGHWHKSAHAKDSNGINYIVVTSSMYSSSTGTVPEIVQFPRVLGTASETAFDIFCIDQDARKIHIIRYGAGGENANREFTY